MNAVAVIDFVIEAIQRRSSFNSPGAGTAIVSAQ